MGLAIRICTTDPLNCTVTPFPLFPPPPPTSTMGGESASQQFNPLLIIVFAILGGTFLLLTYYSVVLKYCSCLNRLRMVHPPPPPQGETGREDLLDEDHGPVIDHPIWFIRTVGLAENIINSIDVFKYKKGEGLIDGTECSVCLGEFEEDEKLRLLPKCSHAFHLPCIDTWLRSHTNCPLCRAPIVSNPAGASDVSTVTEMHSSNLSTVHETEEDSPDREGASRRNPSSEGGSGYEIDLIVSDGTREVEKAGVTEEGEGSHIQPVRRSFSMGSLAAAMVCFSLANLPPSELESSSSTRVVSVKESNSDVVVKSEGESSTILNQMGSSFSGEAPKAGPIAMKRSVSTSAKYLLSRYAGTKSSILPL